MKVDGGEATMPYHIIGKRLPVKLVWMREPDFVSLGCLVPRMGLRASWATLHDDPWRDKDGHSVRHIGFLRDESRYLRDSALVLFRLKLTFMVRKG